MSSEKVLSVVVPSYNIEDYIERLIQSFLEIDENYQEMFEVIIVNDGSKDNTVEVAERLIDNHPFDNIKVINKANGGHGSTINRGVLEAKGKYFKVIDGDDWVDKQAFEELLDKLKVSDIDLVITDFTKQFVLDDVQELVVPISNIKSNELYSGIPKQRVPMHSVTYKTSLLRDNCIQLTEKVFYVDLQYTFFPLMYVKNWIYYPLNVYQYLLGRVNQSVSIDSYIRNSSHHLIVLDSILEFYGKVQDEDVRSVLQESINQILDMQLIINYLSNDREELMNLTLKKLDLNKFKYSILKARKLSRLIYLQERLSFLNIILSPIIDLGIKKLKEDK